MLMAKEITGHLTHFLGQADVPAKAPDPVEGWVMVIVRPGMEQEARDSLRRRGVGCWWPNYPKEVGAKDRDSGKRYKRSIRASVLPGVILCPAKCDQNFWLALDLAPGAMNVARKFNTDIIVLSDLDVVLIHKIEAGQHKTEPPKVKGSYKVGDDVRLIDDELRRFPPGKVARIAADGALTVEVNLFGRMTPVEVQPWQVEPVEMVKPNRLASKSTDARDRPAKSPSGRNV